MSSPPRSSEEAASGARRIVLDSTYLTRAARSYVLDAAARQGLPARCIWLDTPLAQAQVNMVERMLDRLGALPAPDELRDLARRGDGLLAPTSQMRAVRELEPPSADEGWTAVERVPFTRVHPAHAKGVGVFVAAGGARAARMEAGARGGRSLRPSPRVRLAAGGSGRCARRGGSARSRRRCPVAWRALSARTPRGRRAAGAGRRCPACRSRSRERTASILRARSSSAPRPAHRTLAATIGARYADAG